MEAHSEDAESEDHMPSCIICLSVLQHVEAVWSCEQCFCVFHLSCIQAWARDSVSSNYGPLSRKLFPDQPSVWSCPKCRRDYPQSTIPTVYRCFCGKEVDPHPDPWVAPHSCGNICGRKGHCEHTCPSLCHQGPCPPCPKTVLLSCYCGRSAPVSKRCGVKGWMCGQVCGRVLSCGLHTCEEMCHAGECPPCGEVVVQPCQCGKNTKERPCDAPDWSCDQPCLKPLSCGHHYCQKVCHHGNCGVCQRSLPRSCPCGKTMHTLPCVTDVPVCGDSCDKLLSCGLHRCSRPCHHGDCGPCVQVVNGVCRCGRRGRTGPCSQQLLCDTRCTKLRRCGRHPCRRKCCDGNCLPCEQVCNKPLQCKNHKCHAPCHQGRCYPCIRTVDVTCHCGVTKVTVPCGREKLTPPPKCPELCTIPSKCNHRKRQPHPCHAPPCPPCTLTCEVTLSCGHTCRARCHSTPHPKPRPPGLAPWVKMADSALVIDPCPPCTQFVRVVCMGGHESEEQVCSQRREYVCGRVCGRRLNCGNHYCQQGCHRIINAPGEGLAGDDCLQCERECDWPRPPGCPHGCPAPCHSGECPRCDVLVKLDCHCHTLTLFVKCHEWCAASIEDKDQLCCCGGQCVHKLSCGHRCPLTCHSGPCPDHTHCKRKVTSRCPCGQIKKESVCCSRVTVSCDEECTRIANERREAREAESERVREEAEAERLRVERERERMSRPHKRRRKTRTEEEATPSTQSHRALTVMVVLLVALVVGGVAVWTLVM